MSFWRDTGAAVLAGMGLNGSESPVRCSGYETERQAWETL